MRSNHPKKSNLTLLLAEPEFRYLTTIMQMYVDNGKAYVQVATGALLLPITFLRNILGLGEHDALTWIPAPIWISWISLLLSIGAGLLYQVKAVGYLERAMEDEEEDPDSGDLSAVQRWKNMIETQPGIIFDLMAVTFYLGIFFFVIGAVEVRHYHTWLPYVLYPSVVILTGLGYYVL
jgi:hypothetical protein